MDKSVIPQTHLTDPIQVLESLFNEVHEISLKLNQFESLVPSDRLGKAFTHLTEAKEEIAELKNLLAKQAGRSKDPSVLESN